MNDWVEPLPNKFKTLDDTKCKLIAVLRILK